MYLHIPEVMQEIFAFTPDSQYVYIEFSAQVYVFDAFVDKPGSRDNDDFRYSYVVKIKGTASVRTIGSGCYGFFGAVPVENVHAVFSGKFPYLVEVSRNVEDVPAFKGRVGRGELGNGFEETVLG